MRGNLPISGCNLLALISALYVCEAEVAAQWVQQRITLNPGWNAVYLEVQPEPKDCEAVFAGLPIENVWAWNRRFSSVQFIQDASSLVPRQPEWLTYFPADSGEHMLANLFIVQGGHAYLIKLGGNKSVNWLVKGKPIVRSIDWVGDSFNLVGFRVDPNSPPTFSVFFAPSPAHTGQPVYRLGSTGKWERINPPTERIRPGQAYWVYCVGQSSYSGPLKLTLEQGGILDFGRTLTEQTLRIKNEAGAPGQVTLRRQTSATPPDTEPSLAGEVLLSYWNISDANDPNNFRWLDFPERLQLNIEPREELGIRIAVRRGEMPGTTGDLYQSLLEVLDQQGLRLWVPVAAEGLASYEAKVMALSAAGGISVMSGPEVPDIRAGLWVGTASINKVSFAADPNEHRRQIPQPTATEFDIRLIIHVDANGQAVLLQQAILMWKEGTTKPDPADPSKKIVDEPGRYVILTRDDLIPRFSGTAVRDGKAVGRRISSSAFAHLITLLHPDSLL